jgi:hypothetical protein
LNVVGTGLTTQNIFGYNLLETGTITGFTFSLDSNGHKKLIAEGSNYSIPAGQLSNALEQAVLSHNASLFFSFWFQFGATVSGTARIVEGNLENLLSEYVNIVGIDITSGAVSVSAAKFATYENVLNEISAGFSISDTSTKVQPELGALAADVAHINSISFTNASPVIKLTAAENTADAGALAKISSAYVLDVHKANGSWTTTGHGDNLTINDIPVVGASVDTITGGGSGENFVFNATFGNATLVDFHNHLTSSTHDTVTLALSEFHNIATLLNDARNSGANVIISSGTDHLTLDNMTHAQLKQIASTDFKLV